MVHLVLSFGGNVQDQWWPLVRSTGAAAKHSRGRRLSTWAALPQQCTMAKADWSPENYINRS